MLADRSGEQAARELVVAEVELAGPVDGVGDLPPADQVATVEDGQAGEIAEAGVDQIEVPASAHHRGIGVEAGEDRVAILRGSRRGAAVIAQVPHLGEAGLPRVRGRRRQQQHDP